MAVAMCWRSFFHGVRAALPIVVIFFMYGMPFGVLATQAGVSPLAAVAMSVFVLGGSAQFATVQLIMTSALPVEIWMTTAFLHLRHIMLSASFALRVPQVTGWQRYLLAHWNVDEVYAVLMSRNSEQPLNTSFAFGTSVTPWLAWSLATAIGAYLGQQIVMPAVMDFAMIIMLAVLLGLSLPTRRDGCIAIAAALATYVIYQVHPSNSAFLCGALVACGVAMCVPTRQEVSDA